MQIILLSLLIIGFISLIWLGVSKSPNIWLFIGTMCIIPGVIFSLTIPIEEEYSSVNYMTQIYGGRISVLVESGESFTSTNIKHIDEWTTGKPGFLIRRYGSFGQPLNIQFTTHPQTNNP